MRSLYLKIRKVYPVSEYNWRIVFFVCLLSFAVSCSNTKYLPKGETLYTGSKIKFKNSDTIKKVQREDLKDELQPLILPKPNSKILGLRIKLWFYNIADTPKGKGLRHLLKNKLGEPPVYASAVDFEKNNSIIINRLQNRGYFKGSSTIDTTTKDQRTSGLYTIKPAVQYMIDTVSFPKDSSELSLAIRSVTQRTALRRGRPYDLDVIKDERIRIDSRLKQKGYFFFNDNYLLVKVDSTIGSNRVNMNVQAKRETPEEAKHPYRIGDVIIFADYGLATDTSFAKDKAVFYDSFYVVDPLKKFNPRMFKRNIRFHPGDLYNRNDHNLTLSRLVSLGVYKFVKARFEASDTATGNKLNTFYYLSPLNTYSAKAQLSALVKSNNSNGTELTLSLKNRNAFRSAEQLILSGFFGIEKQISGQQKVGTTRFGGNIDLLIPRVIGGLPFGNNSNFVPYTKVNMGYEYFRRTDQYTLNSYRTSFGWQWNTSFTKEHQFNPIAINYVLPTDITPEFQQGLDTNITLARSIEKQFIIGSNYNFNYNSQVKLNNNRHNYYFNGNADVSGNLLGLVTGADIENGKERQIFNTPFSQYIRGEAELRHYMAIGRLKRVKINQIVSRIILGAGYGYGNSTQMPFIKQFFIGGTNSIRAYRARSLGPGTYYAGNADETTTFLPDQPGDIKIELNTELRFKIVSIVRGALFVDAGNIFTMKEDTARPGAKFTSNFVKELAVGMGAGIRFDVKFFVLRVDVAFPVRKPYEAGGPQWVFNKINFGDSQWRNENLIINFAIGYPF